MSTVPDIAQGCPGTSETPIKNDPISDELCEQITEKKRKKSRNVCFPDDGELVTQYFEPANPWQHVPSTTRAQLAADYLESCRRHNTPPIDTVLQQIRELPENSIGGGNRAPRLSLAECSLAGSAAVDALEALLRRVQFRRIEVDHAVIDDEGAEALFDMIEYYESAIVVCLSGPRQFGIRGWQAASRMIKKSAELSELEITESDLEASHAPVLARALRPHTCRLRSLCLQRAMLCGEPLLCLVIALKSNSSIRELRLGDNRLTAADAAQLGSLLRLNTNIHLLDLSNNQIQDAGAGHIAEALVEQAAQTPPSVASSPISPHHCPLMGGHETRGLAFLVLWNNQLTRNCAQHLSKALRSSPSLCVLNIGRNALGGETVRALQGAGRLVSLGLQAARLGPEAARAVADLIRHDNTLQRLDLRDNRLGSSGLQAILSAMKENTTLTQIDMDEPTESPTNLSLEDGEAATVARLTRDIRALCRRNEPDATSPERRVHRKISLTCNTTCLVRTPLCMEDERRSSRLRSPLPSPAPSPAGSPVPLQHSHSRFSVTRVTPERESSEPDSSSPSTPTRTTYSPTPSRFKVVQVTEPPQIQVHPASTEPRKSLSRFSVTRNYDKMYNPSPSPSPVPNSGSDTPAEDIYDDDNVTIEDVVQNFDIKDNSRTNPVSVNVEKIISDKQTASDRFSVSVLPEKDSKNVKNNHHKVSTHKQSSDKRFSASVCDNLGEASSKPIIGRIKSGSGNRFSVSNVTENSGQERTQIMFSASPVPENTKHVMPSTSHSDIESVNNHEKTNIASTSQVTSVNISPVGSEISKRFSVSNVPGNINREYSQISDNMDISSIKRISSPENVLTPSNVSESMTTPLTSKNILKSCMRNSENNRQSTSENIEDMRSLRSQISDTGEVLSSHPNLKTISDLFKSLEVYGNTADNTVSLTSLTESKRPSVRDIFNVNPPDSLNADVISVKDDEVIEKNITKSSDIENMADLTTNTVVDDAMDSSDITLVQSMCDITRLTDEDSFQKSGIATSTDDNVHRNSGGTSTDEESHRYKSIGVSSDDSLHQFDLTIKEDESLQNKDFLISNRSHPRTIVMDVGLQTDEFDISKAISEFDRDNNLIRTKIPLVVCEDPINNKKVVQKASSVLNQPKRSESEGILGTIYERNKLHSADEVFIKTPKAENVISTSIVKNVPQYGHIGSTLLELCPGSTPHPSKGVKMFVMPEFQIEADNPKESSVIDKIEHLSEFTRRRFRTENIEKISKDESVDNATLVQTHAVRNLPEINTAINKKDLKKDIFANEKSIKISIEDEFPVFDAKPKQLPVNDNRERIINIVPDKEHQAETEKGVAESDKSKVPDLRHIDSIQVLETDIDPINYVFNISQTYNDLTDKNKHCTNVLYSSENYVMPTFLPEIKVLSNETESIREFNAEPLQTGWAEFPQNNEISDVLIDNITKPLPNVTKFLQIQEENDNLPGAIEPTLANEIPIYSISQLANIPSTSTTIFPPRNVTTQINLSEINADLSEEELKFILTDTKNSVTLPRIVPDTDRQIKRLTQTQIDLTKLAGESRQIETIPNQTMKEDFRSVNLNRAVFVVPENVSAIEKTDYSSIMNSETNTGLEIQVFLGEFRDTPKITDLTEVKTLDKVQDYNVSDEITGAERRHYTKNSVSKESVILTELNLSSVTEDRDRDAMKCDRDTNKDRVRDTATGEDSVIKDTFSENSSKFDAIGDQILCETTVDNQNISDKTNLIYTNICGISGTRNINDNVVYKDSKSVGSSTINNERSKKESICEENMTSSDDGDKTVVSGDKRDQYKDITEILTHSETKNAGVIKSETQLVKNTIEITDEEKVDVELKMTVKKENVESKTCKIQKVVKKEDALKQIELITKDLGNLIDEMKIVTGDRDKKDCVRNTKLNEGDKDTTCQNEQENHTEDLKIDDKELKFDEFDLQRQTKERDITVKKLKTDKDMIMSKIDLGTDRKESDRQTSDLGMNQSELIRDIKETEQYIKYIRDYETIYGRNIKLENEGSCSVKDRFIESHTGTERHVVETERHRKEYGSDTEDHRKTKYTGVIKEPKVKPANVKESVLKKNKSESSLDSSDMEVSRLMHKHINPFCDSSSSLEISGSSIESLTEPKLIITKDYVDSDIELDRRKEHTLSTGSSVESTDVTPMNTNLLNMSVSSNESVSPIFGKTKNIRDSLSSLEASVSSLESNKQDRVMVTSADSGIEHSLPKDIHESSSNEGTLTNPMNIKHDTLTASPKRTSSLLDVPALKSKGLDKMRKISWVAPSSSFNVARQDDKEVKPSHLEKLLSLFQHPSSIFSRNTEEEKKSSTPPKKDSLLTSSFWSWGSGERDKDDSSEATDSTLSERVQISFVDESFSKKLDSKTPSTDTENTLSEFQTFTQSERECENVDTCKVTLNTTDKSVVQIDLSLKCTGANNGNRKVSNSLDVVSPNDFNKNYDTSDSNKNSENSPEITEYDVKRDEKPEVVRPRSFAAVLKASGSENSLEKQNSPEGQPVDKLPSKVIRGIKENISPENTLTSSMSNTRALALELSERQLKSQPVVNTVWELTNPLLDKGDEKTDLAPIATIEETCDESADIIQLDYIDDDKAGQKDVDVAKDALSYLIYENQAFDPTEQKTNETPGQSSLADELKEAEIKEMFDLSPELVIDEAIEVPEVFPAKDVKGIRTSPIIPERAKLKKSNSLEDLKIETVNNPKAKTIVFKVPESKPRDIPQRSKLRSRSGSSPKSLPESLNKPCPLTKIDALSKKKKKVSSLGKMAKDSLLALNMSEDEIAEFRRSYKLTSVESLRSLESVSEDANSQSGNSVDSRCRACLRTSQESLMSLDSITEDICRCDDSEKPGKSHR